MDKKLLIIGAGSMATIIAEYFIMDSEYDVVAFAGEKRYLESMGNPSHLMGRPVIALEDIVNKFPPSDYCAFVATDYNKLNHTRARLYELVKGWEYNLASYVSSKAIIMPSSTIGENCLILEQNVVQRKAIIGNDVYLWSGNHIGHDSCIGNHVYITSQVVISGYCQVGTYTFIGINAGLVDHINVAKNNFIGAGVTITHDTSPNEIYRLPPIRAERLSAQMVFGFREDAPYE